MAESIVQVAPDSSGKKLHTFNRTIGANSVEDEVVIEGLPYLASYRIITTATSWATANDHALQIMAGASLNVYVHRIRIWQKALATTGNLYEMRLVGLSSAGTGGTVQTLARFDATDAAAGATGMTLPTAKGTETSVYTQQTAYFLQTAGASTPFSALLWDIDMERRRTKAIRIPAGTANGIAIKVQAAAAAATVNIEVDLMEANF